MVVRVREVQGYQRLTEGEDDTIEEMGRNTELMIGTERHRTHVSNARRRHTIRTQRRREVYGAIERNDLDTGKTKGHVSASLLSKSQLRKHSQLSMYVYTIPPLDFPKNGVFIIGS